MSQIFLYYAAGICQGRITFSGSEVFYAPIDLRRRTPMQDVHFEPSQLGGVLPVSEIAQNLALYLEAHWFGDGVHLDNGDRFEPYRRWGDGQIWARRGATAVDVVTVQGDVVAFVLPARYGMEVLVRPGMEYVTPLTLYEDASLSKDQYGVNNLGTFLVAMRDGVRLATDVYLPEGISPKDKLPTILIRTCYDRHRNQRAFMRWVNRGYAVVNQDVRGRADSEGDLVPFYYERDDGSDTIDWIGAQSWSNGRVGLWGASYLGYTAVAAATSGNSHIHAVVDEVNVGSPFVDTVRRGGTVCSWPLLSWTLAQSVGTRTDFSIFAGESVNPAEVVDIRPIRSIPERVIGHRSGPWDLWAEHPEYDDFWRNCTLSLHGHRVTAPMLVISGWFDGDSPGVSETWRMLSMHDVPHRHIWLGPWEHNPNRARDLRDQHFGNDAVVYDYDIRVLRWFDRFLKQIDNGVEKEPRARYYLMGDNVWRESSEWPPQESHLTPVYLASNGRANSRLGDGLLQGNPPEGGASAPYDGFIYDPHDPVEEGEEREPENRRLQELRHDILVYTSPALTRPLKVAGELKAVIYAASSAVDTDWAATLSDVDDRGNSIRLSSYIVRARYRHGLDAPKPLTPGAVERYDIFLPNIGHVFKPGHRVRVSLTSSSKGVAFPNTNSGENPYDDPPPVMAQQTIWHTPEYPSHILLPLLED
ncbi:CocE/NonD family hydrolase [Sulfobacillus harzensis]|uniref:CocE/NonD family hydrolase n=1 Tax=Sulfobacillus harzensis TaxID=2729629 RepID=A0A7Y0L6A4_9FIRM|nr:CocE/NonD family hydrolase [Sulfobacillus harzensis]NMP24072.1 CocE/NonD family hydrolase [Sulfobacillus harzensis]